MVWNTAMSLYLMRRGKFYICRRGKVWSGTGWTIAAQFGKPFEFHNGLALLEKRFHRLEPRPQLRRCELFHHKPKPKPVTTDGKAKCGRL
jgi:hypothetical protein